jgi:hypothetical protein
MGVQRAMEVGTKIRDWQPFFEVKKEIEKGRKFCSSKSSYSYYVEGVIEELKNENLTVFLWERVSRLVGVTLLWVLMRF